MGTKRPGRRAKQTEAPSAELDRPSASSPAVAPAQQRGANVRDVVGNRAFGSLLATRTAKNLAIRKITAFEGRLDSAQATLSDESTAPVVLTSNGLAPGTYRFERDESMATHYRQVEQPGERIAPFLWQARSVLAEPYERAEAVAVEILPGTPATLREGIATLDPAIRQALTTGEGSKAASYAEMDRTLAAGQMLQQFGVSADELALLEYRRAEARDHGREPVEAVDPVEWASEFVVNRQATGEKALENRMKLVAAREQIDTLPANFAAAIRAATGQDRDANWTLIEDVFQRVEHIPLPEVIAAFETELRSVTDTFLSQSLLALFQIEKTYLADRNIGIEKDRLRQAIKRVRPSLFQREAGHYELSRQKLQHLLGASNTQKVAEWTEEVEKRDEDLRVESQEANLPVANWKGFDADLVLNADVDAARNGLRAFVFDARGRLQRAERMSGDITNLYRADKMVAMAKSAIGIKPGSLLGDVISFRAKRETADDGFWSTLWDVISLALMFVPGNIGVLLRVGAGIANASKTADAISNANNRSMTGMSSEDPSSLSFYLAVGGTLIDAQQMAHGVFKVAGEEAGAVSAAYRGAAPESTVAREGEQAVASIGERDPIAPAPPGGSAAPVPAAPPAQEPIVWVNTGTGPGRGRYHLENTTWFGKTKEGVAMPKSWADDLGFVPAGSPQPGAARAIQPRFVAGRQAESLGVAAQGAKNISATARAESAVLTTSIRADLTEAQGYNYLLDQNELGLQRPFGANVRGVDAITAKVTWEAGRPVSAKIFVNDMTTVTAGKRLATPAAWLDEVDAAVAEGRLQFGDPELERVIRDAASTNVYGRIVRVDPARGAAAVTINPREVWRAR
jgi:hypothetical protein